MVDNFQKTILDRGLRIQDDNLLLKQIESMDKNSKGSDISNIINQIQAELPSEDKKLYIKTLQEKITEFALGNETVDSNTTVADYLVKHLGTLPIPKPLAMSRITALQNALEGTKDKDTEPVQPQQPPALKKAPPVAPKPTIASMLENPKTLGTTVIALINNPNYKLTGDDFNAINAKISAAHINIHENNASLNTIAEPLNIAMNAYVKYMHSNPSPIDKNVMDNAKQIYDLAVEVKPILKDTLDTKQFFDALKIIKLVEKAEQIDKNTAELGMTEIGGQSIFSRYPKLTDDQMAKLNAHLIKRREERKGGEDRVVM